MTASTGRKLLAVTVATLMVLSTVAGVPLAFSGAVAANASATGNEPIDAHPGWPQFGDGLSGDANNSESTGPANIAGMDWRFDTGSGQIYSSPVVVDGVAYVGSDGGLTAIYVANGTEKWHATVDLHNDDDSQGRTDSPVYADGALYVGTADGSNSSLVKIDAGTGDVVWTFDEPASEFMGGAPVVDDGTVYAADVGGTLWAVDASTGTEVANFTTDSWNAIESEPAIGNGHLYLADNGGVVYKLELQDLSEDGSWTGVSLGGGVVSGPAVVDGTVYVATHQGGTVYALNATDGSEDWSTGVTTGAIRGGLAVANGTVYAGAATDSLSNGDVHALDAATGAVRWTYDAGDPVTVSPAVVDGTVYVADWGGQVLALNGSTGGVDWEFPVTSAPTEIKASPAVANGSLYVGDFAGDFYKLSTPASGLPVSEDFDSGTVPADWTVRGDAVWGTSVDGHQALRLTAAQEWEAGTAFYDRPFAAESGAVFEFEYYSAAGTGADGLSVFLVNGSLVHRTTDRIGGQSGGSLGYAQGDGDGDGTIDAAGELGVPHGYLGVGFDEFGHFADDIECKAGGETASDGDPTDKEPDTVVLRGSGDGGTCNSGYPFLTATNVSAKGGIDGGWRTVRIEVFPNDTDGDGTVEAADVSVQMSWDGGATWHAVVDYTYSEVPPAYLKLGVSGSTGGSTNVHAIENLTVSNPADLALSTTSGPSGGFAPGDVVNWTYTVTNDGPNADDGITLEDAVATDSTGIESLQWTVSGDDSGSGTGSTATLSLAPGESATVTFEGTVGDNASGDLDHSATVRTGTGVVDPTPSDANASVTIDVIEGLSVKTSAGESTYYEEGTSVVVDPDVRVEDPSGDTISGATASIAEGFVAGEDVLSYDDTVASNRGISGTYNDTTGVLTFSGSASANDYQDVLRTVTYGNAASNATTGNRSISFTIGQNSLYYDGTGHYYEFVENSGISWTDARDAASNRSYYGLQGYLVTSTSSGENEFIRGRLAAQGWIGASDAAEEGTWRWVTGPEGLEDGGKGRYVYNQTASDSGAEYGGNTPGGGEAVNGSYTNWERTKDIEPNNYGGTEHYGHLYPDGKWNDYPIEKPEYIEGYAVEYGGMPDDPTLELSDSRTVVVADVTAPAISGFNVTNPSGQDVQVSFESDEALANVSVEITGVETATLTEADFAESESGGNYTYTGTYATSTDGTYNATLTVAGDGDGNDGASGESGNVTVGTTAPVISSFQAVNPDGHNVTVSFESDDPLSTIDVGITGAETANLTRTDFTEAESGGNYTYTGTYRGSTDGTYEATLNTAIDASGLDGASGETDSVTASVPPELHASNGTSSYLDDQGPVVVDPDLSLSDPGGGTIQGVTVSISDGFVAGEDVLSYDGAVASNRGISGSYDSTTGVLTFSGSASASDYQAVLRTVTYENTVADLTTTNRTITFTIGEKSLYYDETGHYYEFVEDSGISWTDARDAASARSYYDLQGYLVTITSSGEDEFIRGRLAGEGWIGASDAAEEGTWRWVTGPEGLEDGGKGRYFFEQTASYSGDQYGGSRDGGGYAVDGAYTNWEDTADHTQPDNYNQDEHYGHLYSDGEWNDYPITNADIAGYVVEYGGLSGDTSLSLSDTRTVAVDDVTAPTISEFNVTNPSGQDVQVTVDSDEALANVSVEIAGAETANLTRTDFTEAESGENYTYTATYAGSTDGTYRATLNVATDHVGNDGASGGSDNATVDTTAPVISAFDAANPSAYNVTVTFESDDPLSTIEVAISGVESGSLTEADFTGTESGGNYTYTATYVGSTDGTYNATLNTAIDASELDGASGQTDGVSVSNPPELYASDGSNEFVDDHGEIVVDPSLTVSDPGGGTIDGAKVSIDSGFRDGDTLGWNETLANDYGISVGYDPGTGVLTLTGDGTAAEYQGLLRAVTFTAATGSEDPATVDREITFSIGQGTLYNSETGHYYEYVHADGISWSAARDDASDRTHHGLQGYLVTITSQAENQFILDKVQGASWIGASDAGAEGTWRWVTGPEGLEENGTGRHFFTQTASDEGRFYDGATPGGGDPVDGAFVSWVTDEPNDYDWGGEDYGHYCYGLDWCADGGWNDFPEQKGDIAGYLVEYGGMPDDPSLHLNDRKTVTITLDDPPTADAGTSITTPENAEIQFDASGSTDDFGITDYRWDFGQGDTGTGETATTSYDTPGEYTVELLVADTVSQRSRDTITVTVTENSVLVADAGGNRTIDEDASLRFDASGSQSNEGIERYEWDFDGDGTVDATGETTNHAFADPGTSAVEMTVIDTEDNRATDTVLVTVRDTTPPTADAGEDVTVDQDEYVTFDGSGSTDNGEITSYEWDLGDGTTRTGRTLTHAYETPGTYTATLTVTDGGGHTATDTVTVEVADTAPPNADAGSNLTAAENAQVQFDAMNSTDNVAIDSYAWDFTSDGTTDATGAIANHTFDADGIHTVELTVTDTAGNVATDTLTVTVKENSTLIADARTNVSREAHVEATEDAAIEFTASDSRSNEGIASYEWDLDGNGTTDATGETITHTFADPGNYTVTLTLTDRDSPTPNTATDTVTVEVADATAPTADPGENRTVDEDASIPFDGTNSTDNDVVGSYEWDLDGDGATDATGPTPTHTYSQPGTYTVTLTVRDAAGNADTNTTTVTVEDVTPPAAEAGSDATTVTGSGVRLDASDSSDNVGIATYRWDYGADGTVDATGETITHEFFAPGEHAVRLTVVDAAGNAATDTLTVTVEDQADWPTVQGDRANVGHDLHGTGPTGPVEEAWNVDVNGYVTVNPAVVDGTVYVGVYGGNLSAYNADHSERQWTFQPVQNDEDEYYRQGFLWSSPTVVDGTLYIGGVNGYVYAVNASTGTQEWRFDASSQYYIATTPAVADGTVYVGSGDGTLHALDANTGTEDWSFDVNDHDGDTWDDRIRTDPAVVDGVVYFLDGGGTAYAVDAASGAERWRHDVGHWTESSPTVVGNTLYVGGGDESVYALNASDGSVRWRQAVPGRYTDVRTSPAYANGILYVTTDEGNVTALDATDGSRVWHRDPDGSEDLAYSRTSPVVVNGTVYVTTTHESAIYAFDADTGATQWRDDPTINSLYTTPTVVDGKLYYGGYDGFAALGEADFPPTADAGTHIEAPEDAMIEFDGTNSTDDNGIASYAWDFGDGANATGSTPTHAYEDSGTFTATLTVTDADGQTDTDAVTVTVLENSVLIADGGPNVTAEEDTWVGFDATESKSNEGIATYEWDFDGDGTVDAAGPTSTHTFADPGTYAVELILTDAEGNVGTDTVTATIADTTPPTAAAGADRTVDEGETLTFDAGRSTDNGRIVSYQWNFGRAMATGETVTHAFQDPGSYAVTLTVADADGNTDTAIVNVTVRDVTPPQADAGGNITVPENGEVEFDATNSTDNDAIDSYAWDFDGDGTTDASTATANHTFDRSGTYTTTLTVTDEAGNAATDSLTVTVFENSVLIGDAGDNRTVDQGETVTFDASGTQSNEGGLSFAWDLDDDGTTDASRSTPTHSFATVGTHEVTVTITDAEGNTATDSVWVTVRDGTRPTADAGGSRSAPEDTSIDFDATNSTDNVGIASYQWDFDDDAATEATGPTASHTFADPGTYTVTLLVTDEAGNRDAATVSMSVADTTAPTADAGKNLTVGNGSTVRLSASGSVDNVGIDRYEWDFDDDGTTDATGSTVSHTFGTTGTHRVTLAVVDAAGNADTDTVTVTVEDRNAPSISAFGATNPSSQDVRIAFEADERLSTIEVAIGGAETATLSTADFTRTAAADGTFTYAATYAGSTDGTYSVTLETAADADGNDGATGQQDRVTVDTTAPSIEGFEATNPSDQAVRIAFAADERLAGLEVAITGPETATLERAAFTENATDEGNYAYVATYDGSTDGTYTATLETAADGDGNDGTAGEVDAVTIDTTAPTADAGRNRSITLADSLSVDASDSADNVGIERYEWDFGDGTTATGSTATHRYASPGEYTVTLTVTDVGGHADTDTLTVVVEDATPPTAVAGDNRIVEENASVTFDATNSTDNVGIERYEWDFGDDTTGTGPTPTHTYLGPGTYTVTLTVTDGAGNTDTDTLAVAVTDATAPSVSFDVSNPSGREVRVAVETDERLAALEVSIGGAESAMLTRGDFTDTATDDGTVSYTATYVGDTDGTYTATLESAADAQGNDGAAGQRESVTVDTTAPSITGFEATNPSGQSVRIAFDADERLSAIEVSIGGAESATLSTTDFTATENDDGTFSYVATHQGSTDGKYTATLESATDADGNDGASGQSETVVVDTNGSDDGDDGDGDDGDDGHDGDEGSGGGDDDSGADSDDDGEDGDGKESTVDVDVYEDPSLRVRIDARNVANSTALSIDTSDRSTRRLGASVDRLDLRHAGVSNFTMRIRYYRSNPRSDVSNFSVGPGSAPLQYVSVEHSFGTADLSTVRFRLRVDRSRLQALGVTPQDVVVGRYHDGSWQTLSSDLVAANDTRVVYEVKTPGFSLFAVAVPQPSIAVESLETTADAVRAGQPVAISTTVRNRGRLAGNATFQVRRDGSVLATRTIRVPARDTAATSLTRTFDAAGTYTVVVGNRTTTIRVGAQESTPTTATPPRTTVGPTTTGGPGTTTGSSTTSTAVTPPTPTDTRASASTTESPSGTTGSAETGTMAADDDGTGWIGPALLGVVLLAVVLGFVWWRTDSDEMDGDR